MHCINEVFNCGTCCSTVYNVTDMLLQHKAFCACLAMLTTLARGANNFVDASMQLGLSTLMHVYAASRPAPGCLTSYLVLLHADAELERHRHAACYISQHLHCIASHHFGTALPAASEKPRNATALYLLSCSTVSWCSCSTRATTCHHFSCGSHSVQPSCPPISCSRGGRPCSSQWTSSASFRWYRTDVSGVALILIGTSCL